MMPRPNWTRDWHARDKDESPARPVDLATGGRLSLRNTARQMLEAIDRLAEHELAASGWKPAEIDTLVRLAAMKIEGVPYGEWTP